MTLTQPVSESGNFTIGELSSLTLGVGESATFTVQPKANFISGNYTDDISISGSSMGQSAESIVKVSFSVNEIYYDLTVDLDGGDGATLSGSFPGGEVIDIDAGSKNNYTFSGWTTSNGGTFADSSAAITTFTMPHADTTITASWIRTLYTIDASAGNGGTISPSGKNTVQAGDNSEYTITPSDGYVISDVKIDGNSIGAVSTYTFDYVQQSHTIEATFKKSVNGASGSSSDKNNSSGKNNHSDVDPEESAKTDDTKSNGLRLSLLLAILSSMIATVTITKKRYIRK